MHILFITHYYDPDSGAAAVRLSRLARILNQRGHRISVVTTMPHYPVGQIADRYRGRFAVVEDRDGIRIIRTWLLATSSPRISRKLLSQNTFMLTALLRGLGVQRPDVMFIEAQPVFTSLAGVILSRIKRVPYILNVSDLWPDHLLSVGALTETHPIYRISRRMVDTIYRGAAGIAAMSPGWAEKIAGYIGSDDKISVIYNGVDLARFHPGGDASEFLEKHYLPLSKEKFDTEAQRYSTLVGPSWQDGPTQDNAKDDDVGEGLRPSPMRAHRRAPLHRITFIGTFATQYDFDAMFEVAKRFVTRNDVIFVFIGSGSQAETVKQFDLPNVRHIGWIAHDEIPQAWAASTLTYWAMRDEPLYRGTIPAKLYEALACGVPVAAAIEGEGARMIGTSGGGLTVPCGDIDGLARAITRLLEVAELREECSRSGRAYAEAHFDPEGVAAQYESLLQAAIRS